jgi:hypothetical protein
MRPYKLAERTLEQDANAIKSILFLLQNDVGLAHGL